MVFKPACVCHQTTGEMLIKLSLQQQHNNLNMAYFFREIRDYISTHGLFNECKLFYDERLENSKGLWKPERRRSHG